MVRLYVIDTPEKAQAFGNVAKKLTTKLCAGKIVDVTGYDIDKYGRTVGVVTVGKLNVNQAILEAGLGWQIDTCFFCFPMSRPQRFAPGTPSCQKKNAGPWI